MPPRTRTTKTTKGLKENIGVVEKTKSKAVNKVTKPPRKALADKTNSASDDNASIDVPKKLPTKTSAVVKTTKADVDSCNKVRPRRDRRLPNRFVENQVLNNLSNSKDNAAITPVSNTNKKPGQSVIIDPSPAKTSSSTDTNKKSSSAETSSSTDTNKKPSSAKTSSSTDTNKKPSSAKTSSSTESPFKTPLKDAVIGEERPRRICRLPLRFEDHSMSPTEFVHVKPVHASTPIVQKNVRPSKTNSTDKSLTQNTPTSVPLRTNSPKKVKNSVNKVIQPQSTNSQKKLKNETSADTNNNAKVGRALRNRKKDVKTSPTKVPSPKKVVSPAKKRFNKNLSFRILDDKKSSKNDDNCDVYEFTYDPNEEPPPQKKKRKRVVKKKPAKPKTVVFINNYDKNVSKVLTALKNVVSKKQTQPPIENTDIASKVQQNSVNPPKIANVIVQSTNDIDKTNNYNSVHVEDIAADFEPSLIDYSPVNSPCRSKTPILEPVNQGVEQPVNINDPLNLQEHLSFFDENPVASSSMNTSVRHPLASPWRVEFESLPIRWHVNSYVKPNMTPAVECSYVNFDEKKKHVYTNMLPESNNSLPQIVENTTPNMKQTSIISFIREVVEKSESKKRRALTQKKTNLDNITSNTTTAKKLDNLNKTPSTVTPEKITENQDPTPDNIDMENISDAHENTSNKENSRESLKRKNSSDLNAAPAKTPRKDNENTLFGFDDSENQDQENVSPKKIATRKQGLRSRGRAILKEINEKTGPTRAAVPVSVKTILNSEVNKLYDNMKSATDAPVFPEKDAMEIEATDVNEVTALEDVLNEDSQSVHLFEDIEFVHHLKPHRKSYGKAKKLTFIQHSSDSDTQGNNIGQAQSDEDDLADLTFEMPSVKQKKASKKKPTKKKLSKKEEAEVEAWVAGFNSMCEDIDDFDLVVE